MTPDLEHTAPPYAPEVCWFCESQAGGKCQCGRAFCTEHSYESSCLICAVLTGMFEQAGEDEPLSTQIMLGLRTAAGDPYIVLPQALQYKKPLSLPAIENTVAVLIQAIKSQDDNVRRRAGGVLATTTNSWPSMNPSPLERDTYSISLLCADQVRRWLLYTLKNARIMRFEPIALAILDKLRTADFHDLYPGIRDNLKTLTVSNLGTRVREVYETMVEFYPTNSPLVNERCELMAFEHYARSRGGSNSLQRIYGPLMKYSPILGKMLKKGTWLANQRLYSEWYYGEDEPV
jgi:hypothetical protein